MIQLPRLKSNTSFSEKKTLTLAHSLLLKHTDSLYCIDIDEPSTTSMDELKALKAKKVPTGVTCSVVQYLTAHTQKEVQKAFILTLVSIVFHTTQTKRVFFETSQETL